MTHPDSSERVVKCINCGEFMPGFYEAQHNEVLRQLSTVLARESATTARYDAKLEKMLELLVAYRSSYQNHTACRKTDTLDLRCAICKYVDVFLAGEGE